MSDENKQQSPENNEQEFDVQKFFNLINSGGAGFDILNSYGFYNNPLWRNEILKQLTSTPNRFDRDKVEKLIQNPVHNEKALKDLAQYLMNTSMHFKRIVHYFAHMLDFRFILKPLNPPSNQEGNKQFLKSYNKALDWFNKFNVKYEFGKVMETIILEDADFTYVRENAETIKLQRMPSDYSMIVDQTDLGYQYAFNMVYFMRPGVSLEAFAPEFRNYYDDFVSGEKSVQFFWKDLDPEKAWVFKWDENFAGIIPVLLGLYLDTVDIDEFKRLIKSKTQLENWKILFQRIPMRNGDKAGKNDFLIDETTAGKFHANIKKQLPEGTSIITSPMEIDSVSFDQAETRNNIVGYGEQAFFSSAGVPPILFGGQTTSSGGLNLNIEVDAGFVDKMYQQFARFINFQLSRVTGKYKFVVDFLGSTRFNRQQQIDNAVKILPYGFPISLLEHGYGMIPGDMDKMLILEDITGIRDRLKPLLSAHTTSGSDEGGREKKKDSELSDAGVATRDNGSNDNRL